MQAICSAICDGNIRPSTSTVPLSEREMDITAHIGGSIVFKLKKRYRACRKAKHEECILYLGRPQESASATSLTTVLDRGGLVHLSAVASDVFVELETTFRECFCDSDRVMQLAKYMRRISDTVIRNFYEATCDSSVTDAVRDPVLGDVIKLFSKFGVIVIYRKSFACFGQIHILRENKNRCEKI